MTTEIHANKEKGYLHVIGPSKILPETIRSLREQLNALLQQEGIDKVLEDVRSSDFSEMKVIDTDDLALSLESELPAIKRFALICEPHKLTKHFVSTVHCTSAIELQVFQDFDAAQSWLCADTDATQSSVQQQ